MAAIRFMRKGTTKIWWVATVASPAAATVANFTAGTNITKQVNEVNGFSFTNNPISVPDMDSRFSSQVTGEDTAENSNFVMYELKGTPADTIRPLLAKDATGYVAFFYAGLAGASPAAGDKYELFPAVISSNVRRYTAGNEAATYVVSITITDVPVEGTTAA